MDKKTQRKLNREARKTARDLKQCSDEKFNELINNKDIIRNKLKINARISYHALQVHIYKMD